MRPRKKQSKSKPRTVSEPSVELLTKARQAAALSRKQAAEMVHTSRRNWEAWEQERNARRMPAGLFELFLLKTGQFESARLLAPARDTALARLQLQLANGETAELHLPREALSALFRVFGHAN